MESVFVSGVSIPTYSLFFQKSINDFFNYEKKLILAVLKEPALELWPRKAAPRGKPRKASNFVRCCRTTMDRGATRQAAKKGAGNIQLR
jgi:hypothetical protein